MRSSSVVSSGNGNVGSLRHGGAGTAEHRGPRAQRRQH